jgi:hypothetical protein
MVYKIGEAAGKIWRYLSETEGWTTVTQLKIKTKLPVALFHQGLGWLAREDKIQFYPSGNTTKVSLKR